MAKGSMVGATLGKTEGRRLGSTEAKGLGVAKGSKGAKVAPALGFTQVPRFESSGERGRLLLVLLLLLLLPLWLWPKEALFCIPCRYCWLPIKLLASAKVMALK